MRTNVRTMINVVCSIMVLVTNVVISLFLSPFIVKNIGVEANGFVTLANNFVIYAQLIVTALNSMAARYITVEYVSKNYEKSNLYYNSVFWGNLIIVGILFVPAIIVIVKLNSFIDVPREILRDVQVLFVFVFFSFFLTTGLPNWEAGTYVTNRLDRSYVPQMVAAIIKCCVLFGTFLYLPSHIWYVGVASTIATLIVLVANSYNTHDLTPELKINLRWGEWKCSWNYIKELVGSGIWNTVSNVGNLLLSGLDLIICNLMLGATAMGVLALSKILPNYMQQLSASIRNAFAPEITINYAKGDKEAVYFDVLRAMKITSVIMTIPIAGIIVLGDYFFALWVPNQDAYLLHVLSILSILGYAFTSGIQILYNVFITVNKVKQNAIAMIISGCISTGLTLLIVKYTDYGIYAVAGVSTVVNLMRNMLFTVPAASMYLGFRWNQFFSQVAMTVISTTIIIGVGFGIKRIVPSGTWGLLILAAVFVTLSGSIVNGFIILNKADRDFLRQKLKSKIKK